MWIPAFAGMRTGDNVSFSVIPAKAGIQGSGLGLSFNRVLGHVVRTAYPTGWFAIGKSSESLALEQEGGQAKKGHEIGVVSPDFDKIDYYVHIPLGLDPEGHRFEWESSTRTDKGEFLFEELE